MKKVVYYVELRICERMEDEEEREFYYSDGYVTIDNNIIESYLTDDLIIGEMSKDFMHFIVLNYWEEEYYEFLGKYEFDIYFPENYILNPIEEDGEIFGIMSFIEKVKDVDMQKEICIELQKVKNRIL